MQAMTSVPIIHMVEETIKLIRERFGAGSRIGILATNGTMRTGIYAKVCEQYDMELFVHDDRIQDQAMKIIYTNVKSNMDFSPDELEALIDELVTEYDCRCVILACTELSCIKLSRQAAEVSVDAMQVLVEKAITLSGKEVKTIDG
jgi:aspartate racemase